MAETPVPYLLRLQPELMLEIINYLRDIPAKQHDLYNWSSVSSHFRSLLAPYLFTSTTLRNTEKSGSSIDLLAKSNYCQYIREFGFEGNAPGDEEDDFSDTEGILPEIVERVISDLSRFPNLEKVCIEFSMDFDGGWEEGFMLFQDFESPEERIKAEQEEAWRALNTKVYAALARNINPGFKKLELRSLIPAEPSSFSTAEFRALLGQMTHFKLSCWVDISGNHYSANTRYGYVDYTRKYDELLFNHLFSVTHLSISAADLPVRLSRDADPSLNRSRMPLLRSIKLFSIFIDSEIKDFLISHADALESIQFEDCHAGIPSFGESHILWEELFTALSQQNPMKLHEFSVEPSDGFELFSDYHSTQAEKDEAALATEFLKTHPERRLFSYSYIDEKYGFLAGVHDTNLESFRRGNDLRSYDTLMRIVHGNSARLQT